MSPILPKFGLFDEALRRPNDVAVVSLDLAKGTPGRSFTYGRLIHDVLAAKEKHFGGKNLNGAHIAFLIPKAYEYVVVQWSIWASGGCAVPLCVTHPPAELEYVIRNSEALTVLYHSAMKKSISPLFSGLETASEDDHLKKVSWIETENVVIEDASDDLPDIQRQDFDVQTSALMIYTSGTTGKPKGVISTYANVEAQVTSLNEAWEWSHKDRILHELPLHHIHGIINILTCCLWSGATVELDEGKFDPVAIWKRWASDSKEQMTLFMAVPTIYSKLSEVYSKQNLETQHEFTEACKKLRLMVSGSSALPESVFKQWEQITGHKLLERYGMTEIGMGLGNPLHGPRIPGTVGKPFPGVEVRIVPVTESDDSTIIDDSENSGELQIRGPQIFKEYWKRPDATAESFVKDEPRSWFRTGDIACITPEGVYKILGRASADIIKTSGYKVSALDIEREILEYPAVKDIAVLGIPSEAYGETVGAMLVLKQKGGEDSIADEIRAFLKPRLAHYKIPRVIKVVDEIPRNALGKVNKRQLVVEFS